ncbi:1,4-dihydroxy-2-naphthoate polyprenyltransferase [Gryllotalpicola ginsengisoli]|uniref:1,4-dihydroxy-2-naphthoate polyprenyltransferase n=1 Tax=Gryllotalpicola ginsengisoli TaxID=444608 RepID=UPI0003B2E8FD|nr:1,4-dihydroxy-2-naphthoate polyprenyltransferase [Gryllotalpicola ginsengisoli]
MSTRAKTNSRRPGGNPAKVPPATLADWIGGARLRTLPLAVAPVIIGTGAARAVSDPGEWHWVRALAALAVALLLQIGVNYANDYSDGVRGTDQYRLGPSRLTGSGRAKPKTVLTVALSFFAAAAVVGIVTVIDTQLWWLLAVGAASVAAGWFYTGGKHPYGYYGLGEVFVFAFFGVAATAGTQYVQIKTVSQEGWIGSAAAGLLACAVLMVNNIRDIDQDRLARKRTLAVLVGPTWSKVLYTVFVLLPFAISSLLAFVYPIAWLTLFVLLMALPAVLITCTARTARELILALQLTSLTALAYAIFVGWALAF